MLNFCWVSLYFDVLIANISWTVAQTAINHIIFGKSVMKAFRWIYVNCFNRLRFLAEVSAKWGAKKSYQLMDYILDRCLPLRRNIMSYWRIYFMLGGVAPYLAKRVHDSTVRVAKWVMSFWFICYCLADLLGSYENYWHSRYIQWVLAFEVVVCGSIWGCILHLREFRMCGYLKP